MPCDCHECPCDLDDSEHKGEACPCYCVDCWPGEHTAEPEEEDEEEEEEEEEKLAASSSEIRFAEARARYGLDPALADLSVACADWFVLERLSNEGYDLARRQFATFTAYLAGQFSAYLELAIAGELRHAQREDCQGCETELCTCPPSTYSRRIEYPLRRYLRGVSSSNTRTLAWSEWLVWRVENPGREPLDHAAILFDAPRGRWFAGGYGGSLWASASRILADYQSGKLSVTSFVNLAWSLEHNNGSMLNKLWKIGEDRWSSELARILELQAHGDYATLEHECSSEVRQVILARESYKRSAVDNLSALVSAMLEIVSCSCCRNRSEAYYCHERPTELVTMPNGRVVVPGD